MNLPPGHRGVPGVGSLFAIRSNGILRFLRQLHETYGDVATYRVPGRRTVLVNRPELAREILLDPDGAFRLRSMSSQVTQLELIQWPASQWTRTGDRTESVVRRVGSTPSDVDSPGGSAALDRLATLVEINCAQFAEHWLANGDLKLADAAGALTAALIRSVLLGLEPEIGAAQELSDAMLFALSEGRAPAGASRADRQRWRTLVGELRTGAMSSSRYDGEQAVEQANGFAPLLLATYSPMSSALTWILYLLAARPEVRTALLDDLGGRTPVETAGAPYLTAVVREALRLYPPGLALVRFATRPAVVGEYTLPAGTRLLVSPFLLHRHPALWSEPDTFRPERFSSPASPHHAYLPFGLGPGTCPGKAVGILILRLTLAALVRRIVFRPQWTHPAEPELRWAVLPDRPLPVSVSRLS
jgi:cytochrome P450